ncbi:MAG: hypothetical protein AABP62_28160, partial [Planctomycetota bacterium]
MAKSRALPILSVMGAGSQEFPRYLISDTRDRLWTGHDFGPSGVLYAQHEAAACEIHNILKGHFEGVKPVRYVVPLAVEVFSHTSIHVAEVARHLSRSSRLYL